MSSFDFVACVVGAGAVGLACGFALSRLGLDVVVVERERAIGQGISSRNSEVVVTAPFERAMVRADGGFGVEAGGQAATRFTARLLVIAAGLGAQACASRIEGFALSLIPRLHYGEGMYFRLNGRAPFEPLIYPLPIPGALGTHYRKDLGGQAVFWARSQFRRPRGLQRGPRTRHEL